MTPEQKLTYEQLKVQSERRHNKVFEALGWMHAECISMIETGMHPAAADVAKLVGDARRDLKLDEPIDWIPVPPDCDYARKMILVASEYLKGQGEDPGPIAVSVETANRMMAALDRAEKSRADREQSFRFDLGQAISDFFAEFDPNKVDWCDAHNIDALVDHLMPTIRRHP